MSEVIPADAHPEKRACSRRKFGESEDIALLKEVLACGAHTCRRGSQMDKFDELSVSLNSNGALPLTTDGKHCLDRYKLLVASFKRTDRARASASGIEEPFGEKEELLADIASAVDDANEHHRTERSEAAVRDTELLRAGEAIRFQAMNRRGRSMGSTAAGVPAQKRFRSAGAGGGRPAAAAVVDAAQVRRARGWHKDRAAVVPVATSERYNARSARRAREVGSEGDQR
jgi:hypothetical protein